MKRLSPLIAAAAGTLLVAVSAAVLTNLLAWSASKPPQLRAVPVSYLQRIGLELQAPAVSPLCELPSVPGSTLPHPTCPISLEQAEKAAGEDSIGEAVLSGVRFRSHVTGPAGYPTVWVLVTRPSAGGAQAAACLPVDGVPTAQPCAGSYPKLELVAADSGKLLVAYALGM